MTGEPLPGRHRATVAGPHPAQAAATPEGPPHGGVGVQVMRMLTGIRAEETAVAEKGLDLGAARAAPAPGGGQAGRRVAPMRWLGER